MIRYIIEAIWTIGGNGNQSSVEYSVFALDDLDFRDNAFGEWKESMQTAMSRFSDVRMTFIPTRVRRVEQEFRATDIVIPR